MNPQIKNQKFWFRTQKRRPLDTRIEVEISFKNGIFSGVFFYGRRRGQEPKLLILIPGS
jgi:hypothetical protein